MVPLELNNWALGFTLEVEDRVEGPNSKVSGLFLKLRQKQLPDGEQ